MAAKVVLLQLMRYHLQEAVILELRPFKNFWATSSPSAIKKLKLFVHNKIGVNFFLGEIHLVRSYNN